MKIVDLAGKRVALWGWGREGRAAYTALRTRLPPQALTLFCSEAEAVEAAASHDPLLAIEHAPNGERLGAFDVVVKSPGISPYSPAALVAAASGTHFIGGTALWFGERADADGNLPSTICVTGTKGKSTTSSLLAHLLRAAGMRTALAGNIGVPLLELLDGQAEAWAIELSSYQTRDVAASGARPGIAIVTNLHPEHLDWHGSEARYIEDKLALLTEAKPRIAVLNAADPRLAALPLPDSEIQWYGDARGWHLREDALYRADEFVMDTASLPLPGWHNRSNLCAVLTALDAFGLDAAALAPHAATFQPLPNRLQPLGERDGILYVNDSISTTPMATLAALALYRDRPVALLVGGHDRGLPWDEFAAAMRTQAPRAIVTLGQNGPRIRVLLDPIAEARGFALSSASDLAEAMSQARAALPAGGVVLLSPGAPSFGMYKDYVARGRHFAELAGFDPDAISGIAGMGIA
ncbi:UDP-N-acetylmuramoyl-L-alanine--D-glutamate ligase [Thermomonas carbonis]|uniref:UDP-N-acetylmuramoyl-L-alanine--L-glutamate ligase n=1 Tax=Thermomonas carbonis TaxID=1463158 RepID=A0A7G9SR02_9GAMM|nr:UDP-N-acetylmuramoyl-L-alanine--D-glutamate ligase [Thermomonas carbonis]QNN70277.1 UDP-N-acetylmuramoyl-L-alanine--D-glutamate ligase [Thermomonas carbonis]GHB98944.1 UDP-N-acetylmuramoylalanine--D-glutamate ligase [Thermomonas carbonis]